MVHIHAHDVAYLRKQQSFARPHQTKVHHRLTVRLDAVWHEGESNVCMVLDRLYGYNCITVWCIMYRGSGKEQQEGALLYTHTPYTPNAPICST